MKHKLLRVLGYMNLPRILAHHLIGQHHTHAHRLSFGAILMAVGAGVAKIEIAHMQIIFETIGFAVHGMGLTPFVEGLAKAEAEAKQTKTPKCETC